MIELVYLMILVELVLFSIAYVSFNGDFFSPSILTLTLFTISTICFAYNGDNWDVVFSWKAFALFTISFICMISVEMVTRRLSIRTKKTCDDSFSIERLYVPKTLNRIIVLIYLLGVLFYIYRIYKSGSALGAKGFLFIGAAKEGGEYDAVARLIFNLLRFPGYVYAVILVQNVVGCKEKLSDNIGNVLIVICGFILRLFNGQRGGIISYGICILLFANIVMNDRRKAGKIVNKKKFFRIMLITGAILIIVFFLSKSIVKGRSIDSSVIEYLTYYFGSTTALMGKIVDNPELAHKQFVGYFGEKTFKGFYESLYSWGIISKMPADRSWIPLGGNSPDAGNEYTFFCGPYIDFGFWGCVLFIIILYFCMSIIYYKHITNRSLSVKRYTICAIYGYLYCMISYSFYQDTIRSMSRPINILYIIIMFIFGILFVKKAKPKESRNHLIRKDYSDSKVPNEKTIKPGTM